MNITMKQTAHGNVYVVQWLQDNRRHTRTFHRRADAMAFLAQQTN